MLIGGSLRPGVADYGKSKSFWVNLFGTSSKGGIEWALSVGRVRIWHFSGAR